MCGLAAHSLVAEVKNSTLSPLQSAADIPELRIIPEESQNCPEGKAPKRNYGGAEDTENALEGSL